MQEQQLRTLKAYKRSPELSTSTWYKGVLTSHMAWSSETEGAFDFVISKMRAGTEPPPHVHSREHEFMYLLSGVMKFYVDDQVLALTGGECMFLPRAVPHAFLASSDLRRARHAARHPADRRQPERGRPRHRPDCVVGDRGYDAAVIRHGLRTRGILPLLAMRRTSTRQRLGTVALGRRTDVRMAESVPPSPPSLR